MKQRAVIWVLGLLTVLLSANRAWSAESAKAPPSDSWVIFASAGCEECELLKLLVMPALRERVPALPETVFVDLDLPGNYERLLAVEKHLGGGGGDFPVLLAGKRLLYGLPAIEAWTQSASAAELCTPLPPELAGLVYAAASTADSATSVTGDAPATEPESYRGARVLYFATSGCQSCRRVELQLARLRRQYPAVPLIRLDVLDPASRALQMAVAAGLGLPAPDRLATPMVASGTHALWRAPITDTALEALFADAPATPFWHSWNEEVELAAARRMLTTTAERVAWTAVLAAGLLDGINPCAFAVIIFLVSTLSLSGGLARRAALVYGLFFCLGVFMCYLLIGLGFSRLLDALQHLRGVTRAILWGTAAVCAACAVAAASDALRAWRGGAGTMRFGTPKALTRVAHRLIRSRAGHGALLLGALGLGFVISGIELVCTGQVYLPVLVYINSTAAGTRSLALLVAYNTMFIVPLLAVVALSWFGVRARSLAGWAGRHAAAAKAVLALLLATLAVAIATLAMG